MGCRAITKVPPVLWKVGHSCIFIAVVLILDITYTMVRKPRIGYFTKKRVMKILMLGWELPPYNSGGLGTACLQLCKALSKRSGVDIEFVLPYNADHGIDFMTITAAQPQGVASVIRSGIAYDSYKYIRDDGSEEWLNIYDQQELYEKAVAS